MSHELEVVNGQAAMAYVGDVPWHGLGVKLEEGISPVEMMKAAQLDWEVEKVDMSMPNGIVVPGKQALVRSTDNKFLDVVGADWNPVQNQEAFEFFNEFCEAGQMKMHTAGSLFDGKRIWALAKVESDFELFNGDKVEGYLLFSNPHKFGAAIDIRFTPIRVVCNNTLTLSLSNKATNQAKLSHRNVFDAEYAKQILGLAATHMDEYKAVAETLGKVQMTDTKFKEFLGKVFGESKKEGQLTRTAQMAYDVLETQPGADFAKGSWWQGLNAVTYITDHRLGRSTDARIENIWYGIGQKKKINAVKTALEMATA